jgi:hypothetical protein
MSICTSNQIGTLYSARNNVKCQIASTKIYAIVFHLLLETEPMFILKNQIFKKILSYY